MGKLKAIINATDTIPKAFMPTPSTETVLTVPTAKNERFDSQENHSEVPRSPQRPTEANREMLKAMKKQNLADEHARIPVEGKFGNAKRKGTLGRIMAKLRNTSESVIHIGIIVLNLDTWLRAELKWLLDALITCVQDRQRQVRRLRQAIEELTGSILRKMRESQAENRRTRILGILRFHTFS